MLLPGAFRKEDIKIHKLDNGLKILLLEDHAIPNVALYTFITGSGPATSARA